MERETENGRHQSWNVFIRLSERFLSFSFYNWASIIHICVFIYAKRNRFQTAPALLGNGQISFSSFFLLLTWREKEIKKKKTKQERRWRTIAAGSQKLQNRVPLINYSIIPWHPADISTSFWEPKKKLKSWMFVNRETSSERFP